MKINRTPRRALAYAVAFGVFAAAVGGDALAREKCPITGEPIKSENEALELAIKVVKAFKLTTISAKECLHFETDGDYKGSGYSFLIRENHTEKCGGEPETAPLLFTIIVKANGHVTTDANSPPDFIAQKPLRCAGMGRTSVR
jgi:hypothetical protein